MLPATPMCVQVIALSGGWDLPFDRAWQGGPKALTRGWSLYPIFSWRTGFPLDVGAGLNTTNTDPGPAGDGAPGLVRADLALPNVATYDPRASRPSTAAAGTSTSIRWPSPTAGCWRWIKLPKRTRRG
jgi:hypothetical protein